MVRFLGRLFIRRGRRPRRSENNNCGISAKTIDSADLKMRKILASTKSPATIRLTQWWRFGLYQRNLLFLCRFRQSDGGDGFCLSEDKESRACLKDVSNLIALRLCAHVRSWNICYFFCIIYIISPKHWIVVNVLPNALIFAIVAYNMVVIRALPHWFAKLSWC